jgi:eukaryotic-like serine/threonine-protein kinase
MEFLRGQDLAGAARPDALLPLAQVLSIAARVAQALDYAHRHQVVHRDIKPANIMFDAAADGVKVTDFGIARITDANRTRTGMVLGTPSFMSPEQLAGRRVDGRSDLYALGVTLFQLLTGTLPLRGASMNELMQQIAHGVPPDVRSLRPEVPAEVAELVERLLRKAPADRMQTGQEVAEVLHRALRQLAPSPTLRDAERVVYDASRDATGQAMAQMQETVVDPDSLQGVDSVRPAGSA